MNTPRRSNDPRNSGTLLALIALLAAGGGLIGLTALVLPAALGLVAVVFGFFCFGAFHYMLWGWWMPSRADRDDDTPEDHDR